MPSIASRLESDLEALTNRLAGLLQDLPIEYLNWSSSDVIVIAPDYCWGNLSPEQMRLQLRIKRDYEEWFEVFRSVFARATENLEGKIEEADDRFRNWIELGSNWEITGDKEANEEQMRSDAERFFEILSIIGSNESAETVLIPDTNAIVSNPDPGRYKIISSDGVFDFMLLPTILAELDLLKNNHRNPEFRTKVNKAITRIKGWRIQGNLRDGVKVNKTIVVIAIASEPDMENTLSWLDRDSRDDRIIASVLEVQSKYPAARVVLVTGDINLSNKADVARIETAELPIGCNRNGC